MKASVALVVMNEYGHVKRALVVARELVSAGACVHFFTGASFAEQVRDTGSKFHDLFERRPLESVDIESIPIPCRYVSFAAVYAESLASELKSLGVRLVVHDAFAVISIPAAQILGVPRITICAGHNMPPEDTLAKLREDPRVRISAACHAAVERLRTEHGLERMTPFSYADSLSPLLNIVSEPEEFMQVAEKVAFEPIAFFGSLDRPFHKRFGSIARSPRLRDKLMIYCSIGTVASRYYLPAISSLVQSIILTARDLKGCCFMLSTGGSEAVDPGDLPPNVTVSSFVDQADILSKSDVYITHHGMNSTHESIYLLKPMISYPFFHDQPGLAQRCQELGLAVPLTSELRGPVTQDDVTRAMQQVILGHAEMLTNLEQARLWEDNVVRVRPAVVARILGFL